MDQNAESLLAHECDLLISKREIFLNSISDKEDNGLDFRVSNRFLKNISILEGISSRPIIININSLGGDVPDGLLIYDTIKCSTCKTIVIMRGQVCSMASVVAQAATLRLITKNTVFMTHMGTITMDNLSCRIADAFSDIDKFYRNAILDIFASRCINGSYFKEKKYNETRVKSFIMGKWNKLEDWWLTSDQACLYNFADGIFGETPYTDYKKIVKLC